jgi:hypothetical protein
MKPSIRKAMKALGVQPPGSSNQELAQIRLLRLEQIEDEAEAVLKKRDEMRAEAESILKGGARVQTGKRALEGIVYWQRHCSYKKVCSEKQIEEVQAATPWKPHYRLKLTTTNGKKGGDK